MRPRLYLFHHNPIINPDGYLYIQQAKALYYGMFDQVLRCYDYLSPYPIAVAAAYPIFGNWVTAAQSVNMVFSTLALIPLYGLLRCFLPVAAALLTLTAYALLPPYVLVGRDVLRDPTYWFFAVSGLFLFVRHMGKRQPLLLLAGSICLAIGTWSRIECSLFILVSAAFILFSDHRHRWHDLGLFIAPYAAACLAGLAVSQLAHISLLELLKPERIFSRPFEFIVNYNHLRADIKSLYDLDTVKNGIFFFPRVRNLVWWIALGTIIVHIAETLFYLFFVLLVIGIRTGWTAVRQDRRYLYLTVLCGLALVLLYTQTLYNWVMTSRFLAVFLFPAAVFIGLGLEKSTAVLSGKFRFPPKAGYAVICILTLAIFVPKILRANFDPDKLIYYDIGRAIARQEDARRPVSVCGAFKRVRAVHFHANLDMPGAVCFDNAAILRRTDAAGVGSVLSAGYDYFVWDQAGWQGRGIGKWPKKAKRRFRKIGEWTSRDRGKLILYEVIR